jgi:Na+/H+-dicarboxylate symporter/ABC-type amino acid transport substrate-binding protein
MSDEPPRAAPAPLLSRVVIGLIAGVAVGLFFGERAGVLAAVADGFVKLLQMAVLPYVTVSIIASIGALRLEDLRMLGVRAALVIAGLWVLALSFAFLMPLTFPRTQSGSFFSAALLERPPPFDFVDLYIPANPFYALANNVVPAVVLFSMIVGVALIGVPRKQLLLDVLGAVSETLSQAMRLVVRLTPYGIFAIAATTSGTLRLEQASRLEIYLIAYGALALLLGLWVLPGLISALTQIPVREIFASTREALLTAVVAGDLFIVLPVLIGACKGLVARHSPGVRYAQTLPDVIVPVSYNFPHSGKLLSVSFVLFAGWFSDAAIDPRSYPSLALAAVVTLFGSITAAMPFLLDLFRVPADTFQLFLASGIINSRFGTLVAAMHTVTVALLGTCAVTGALHWRPRALARYVAVTIALTVAVVGGTRQLAAALERDDGGGDVLAGMLVAPRADARVLRASDRAAATAELEPATLEVAARAEPPADRLRVVVARRTLRVGYLPDALPFAFFNGRDELVGFDVALMHRLALELGVRLVFVPIERGAPDYVAGAGALLKEGYCDIVIGGLVVTTTRAGLMQLSAPYLDETIALMVPDGDRRRFDSWDAIRAAGPVRIAVPDVPYYVEQLRTRLPRAQLRIIPTVSASLAALATADALALPAERGSAWTLRYPQYSIVVPAPEPIKVPLAYALPRGQPDLTAFLDTWLELKRRDGTLDALYQYWILGRDAAPVPPRWSVIRDVLHWVQ